MRKRMMVLLGMLVGGMLWGCTGGKAGIVPLQSEPPGEPAATLIWNGSGKAFRFLDGTWARDEAYDYEFTVVQRRFDTVWKSIKTLHRRHPDYDGRAGDRSQTLYFEAAYRLDGEEVATRLSGSLGEGAGRADREFRKSSFELVLGDVPPFSPYDRLRIRQRYRYEEGALEETVELFSLGRDGERPFMRIEERAGFFLEGRMEDAPSRM